MSGAITRRSTRGAIRSDKGTRKLHYVLLQRGNAGKLPDQARSAGAHRRTDFEFYRAQAYLTLDFPCSTPAPYWPWLKNYGIWSVAKPPGVHKMGACP